MSACRAAVTASAKPALVVGCQVASRGCDKAYGGSCIAFRQAFQQRHALFAHAASGPCTVQAGAFADHRTYQSHGHPTAGIERQHAAVVFEQYDRPRRNLPGLGAESGLPSVSAFPQAVQITVGVVEQPQQELLAQDAAYGIVDLPEAHSPFVE